MHKQEIIHPKFLPFKKEGGYKRITNNGFTLVELIVVITILAILWTIAFISLQWYSKDARDSTRISDLSSMKSSLELFQLDAGKYPIPTDGVDITYSWWTVWTQWSFWETVYSNTDKLDKIPTDPLSDKVYTYSTTQSKNQYELGWVLEWNETTLNLNTNQTHTAWNIEASAIVTWNYNWQMSKTLIWTTCNILAIPTIITNDTQTSTDLVEIVNNNRLVKNWHKNLPSTFKTSKFKYDWWFEFHPNKLLAYTDTWSCNDITNKSDASARVLLLKWLQEAYSWTTLKNDWEIKNILALNIDTNNPSTFLLSYAWNYVNNNFAWNIIVNDAWKKCDSWYTEQWWNCILNTYTVSWTFWAWWNWASVNVCGTNVTANSSWNFTANINHWTTCNNITATRSGYTCSTTVNWPWSLTSDITNIAWNCVNVFYQCTWTTQWYEATSSFGWCDTTDKIVCTWVWTWYVIAWCNVWTSISWTGPSSYWQLFQWWNSWWTPYVNMTPHASTIDTTGYNDSTYIDSTKFVRWQASSPYDWSSPQNDNLWWNSTWTNIARKWPCDTWYHVPTYAEWNTVRNSWLFTWAGNQFMTILKMPKMWRRNYDSWNIEYENFIWKYWTSTPWAWNWSAYYIEWWNTWTYMYDNSRAHWYPVRCFKN